MKKILYRKTADGDNLTITIDANDNCWSITAELKPKGSRVITSCGCMHDDILAVAPELKPFVDLHLSDLNGIPTNAEANGKYFIKQYHQAIARELSGKKSEYNYGLEYESSEKVAELIKNHFRVNDSELQEILRPDSVFVENIIEKYLPRWKEESDAAMKLLETLETGLPPKMPNPEIKISSEYVGFDFKDNINQYKVKLRKGRKSMTVDFAMGIAHTSEPKLDQVLESLFIDSRTAEDYDFNVWCREFGFDSDSRSAEKTYNTCVKNAKKLRNLLGDEYERVASMYR